ncbi:MAG: hypothetical protein ACKVT1_02380 [Dehalococcoidia bacterium]
MTAKEALRDRVRDLTEDEAAHWLRLMGGEADARSWRERAEPPSVDEMLRMPLEERDAVFRRWPPATDVDELHEWEEATAGDGLDLIDE